MPKVAKTKFLAHPCPNPNCPTTRLFTSSKQYTLHLAQLEQCRNALAQGVRTAVPYCQPTVAMAEVLPPPDEGDNEYDSDFLQHNDDV